MAKGSETSPATDGTGLEPPRSGTAGDASDNQLPSGVTGASAATATQKRGRGRPPKPKSDSQQNGAVAAQPSRKPSGRPKRNAAVSAPTASAAAVVKSGRGRPTRSNTKPVTAPPVTTTAVGGSRKRGRPKKDDVAAATTTVAAPAKKRGRKPKSEEVGRKTVGRTRKATEATQAAADPRELKKKAALLQKKVKQAADKLQIAVSAIEEVQKIAAGM